MDLQVFFFLFRTNWALTNCPLGPGGNATIQSNNPIATYQAVLPTTYNFDNATGSLITGTVTGAANGNGTGILLSVNFSGFPSAAEYGPFGIRNSFPKLIARLICHSVPYPYHARFPRWKLHCHYGPSRPHKSRRVPPLRRCSARDLSGWRLGRQAREHHRYHLLCEVRVSNFLS
jgi:hypothetical protein